MAVEQDRTGASRAASASAALTATSDNRPNGVSSTSSVLPFLRARQVATSSPARLAGDPARAPG